MITLAQASAMTGMARSLILRAIKRGSPATRWRER
jgi:predicted DNA-binding transcriptional regulator AlpA